MAVKTQAPPQAIIRLEEESPTPEITVPVQMPVVVGPCIYRLEAQTSTGGVNPQAVTDLPAAMLSAIGPFTALGGKTAKFVYKGYAEETIQFSADVADPTAASVVSQFNAQTSGNVLAREVEDDSGNTYVLFYTKLNGDDEFFYFTGGDGLTILGLDVYHNAYGRSKYAQTEVYLDQSELPDPDGLLANLNVTESSIRAFLHTGNGELHECKTDRSFIQNQHSITVTGNIDLTGLDYSDVVDKDVTMTVYPGSEATVTLGYSVKTGVIDYINEAIEKYHAHIQDLTYHTAVDTVNLVWTSAYPLDYNASTSTIIATVNELISRYNGHDADIRLSTPSFHVADTTNQQVSSSATDWNSIITALNDFKTQYAAHLNDTTPHGAPDTANTILATIPAVTAWETEIVNELNAQWTGLASKQAVTNYLVLSNPSGRIDIDSTDGIKAILDAGLTTDNTYATVLALDDGDGDSKTPYLKVYATGMAGILSTASTAVLTGTVDLTSLTYPNDVQGKYIRVSVDNKPYQTIRFDSSITTHVKLIERIASALPTATVSMNLSHHLIITSARQGADSMVSIDPAGTDNIATVIYNAAISAVETQTGNPLPVQAGDEVWVSGEKLGTVVTAPIDKTDYILVQLDTEVGVDYVSDNIYFYREDSSVAYPELELTSHGIIVKGAVLKDTKGDTISTGSASLVLSYSGLRLDVSTDADNPSLLVFDTQAEIVEALGPAEVTNPLSFALYQMKAAGPSIRVAAIGISEVSDAQPEGTTAAYAEAFDFLKSWGVYWILPLTHDYDVHQRLLTHVRAQNDESVGKICRAVINPELPTREAPVVVVSGSDGESDSSTNVFDTGVIGLETLLVNAGVDPTGGLTYDDGVYLDIEADTKHYLITSVSGSQVTISTSFTSTQNTDGFYTTDNLPTGLVQQTFSVIIRGDTIATRDEQAEAYNALGQTYANTNVNMIVPDKFDIYLDGVKTQVEGYHGAAMFIGYVASQPPQTALSKSTIPGIVGATRAFPYFSEAQLNIIAGGGGLILWQPDPEQEIVQIRHQLNTDMSTRKSKELNVIRAVDYGYMVVKNTLDPMAGIYNNDGNTVAFVSTMNGIREYLVSNKVLLDMQVVSGPAPAENDSQKMQMVIRFTVAEPYNIIDVTIMY